MAPHTRKLTHVRTAEKLAKKFAEKRWQSTFTPKPRTKGSFFNISGNYFSCKILKLNAKETKDDT